MSDIYDPTDAELFGDDPGFGDDLCGTATAITSGALLAAVIGSWFGGKALHRITARIFREIRVL